MRKIMLMRGEPRRVDTLAPHQTGLYPLSIEKDEFLLKPPRPVWATVRRRTFNISASMEPGLESLSTRSPSFLRNRPLNRALIPPSIGVKLVCHRKGHRLSGVQEACRFAVPFSSAPIFSFPGVFIEEISKTALGSKRKRCREVRTSSCKQDRKEPWKRTGAGTDGAHRDVP